MCVRYQGGLTNTLRWSHCSFDSWACRIRQLQGVKTPALSTGALNIEVNHLMVGHQFRSTPLLLPGTLCPEAVVGLFYGVSTRFGSFNARLNFKQFKALFSIATSPRCCGGHYSFLWIIPLTTNLYLIILSVQQEGITYHFLSLWH